jgi:alpha-beta hydrolase superfamily lysophospholipase
VGIIIYYIQDYIVLHPEAVPPGHNYGFSQPFKEVNIPYNNKSTMNVVQFLPDTEAPKGVVLYFHGNRDHIGRYADIAPAITKQGYEIWMIDYPGFGKSTGTFTEQTLYDWALTFYKLARAKYSRDSIILFGRSLGSAVAAQLASVRDCKRLILEAPFYSLPSVFASYAPVYPWRKIIHYQFPTAEFLQKVDAPVTILHGDNDGVIPIRNARKLSTFLKQDDEFITIGGGSHNDLLQHETYRQKIDSLFR